MTHPRQFVPPCRPTEAQACRGRVTATALAALFLLIGCAEKIPPVSLMPATPSPASGNHLTLGIAGLSDRRSPEQHAGKRPGLIVLGVWNARRGNYVTSDESLGGRVSEAATRGVARALNGGRFGGTRVLEKVIGTDPRTLRVTCREHNLSWIATGTLHDLYGTLHQNAYLLLIPAIYVNAIGWDNEKTEPLGVARLTIDIHECQEGRLVFHRDLAVENHYPGVTLSEAAKLSFEDLLQRLRNETTSFAAPAPSTAPPPPRPSGP